MSVGGGDRFVALGIRIRGAGLERALPLLEPQRGFCAARILNMPRTALHLLPNYEVGGEQAVLFRILEAMGDESFRHVVVGVFAGPQDYRAHFDRIGAVTYDINICRSPISRPFSFVRDCRSIVGQLMEIARREDARIVHGRTHDNDLLSMLLGRRLGIPSVATHAGARLYPDNRTGPSLRRLGRTALLRYTTRRLDALIAVGPDVRDNLVQIARADPGRVHVVRNGIDRAGSTPRGDRRACREALGLPVDRSLLLVVGRLIPAKGVDTLIEAFAMLEEEPHHPTLLVVGEGPELETLTALARDLPEARVRFLGLRDDVPALLAASDGYLSASHSEGTSIALMEGMARALPCVVSDAPGLRDMVRDGENGRLFALRDPRDCARVILETLAEPDVADEMGRVAQAEVRREFSMDTLVEMHAGLYRELIQKFEGRAR